MKKILIALIVFFSLPLTAFGAIAFDAVTSSGLGSFSHTTGAGSDRIMLIGIRSGADDVTAVSYNSSSATLIRKQQVGTVDGYVYIWALLAPSTGSNTVSITGGTGLTTRVVTYTGVNQSLTLDSENGQTEAAAVSVSTTVTNVATGSWVVAFMRNDGDFSNHSSGVASTRRGTSGSIAYFDSNGTVTPAANTITYTTPSAGAYQWGLIGVSLAPAGAVAATQSATQMMMSSDF